MSRCFPYPPPGYEKNGIRDQALIESIKKHQKEGEKAKKEKKERKREKKEKDKSSSKDNGETEKKKHRHKKEKRQRGEKDQEDHNKKRKLESEILEKSNLTEEHGQPVDSQNSFDSTLNSNDNINNNNNNNKRLKPSSPHESCHNAGSIIRIRLPLQRHRDLGISLPSKEQPYPASARIGDKASAQRPLETPLLEQPCSTSSRIVTQEARILSSKPTPVSVPTKEKLNSIPKSIVTSHSLRDSTVLLPGKEKKNHSLNSIGTSRSQRDPGKEKQNHSSKSVDITHSHRDSTVPVPGKDKQNHSSKSIDTSRSHRDSTVPVPGKEKQNHISRSTDTSRRDSKVSVPRAEKQQKPVEVVATTSKENHHHVSELSQKTSKSSSSRKKTRLESKFNDLFENWVPPPMQVDPIDSGNEEWLFESKQKPVVGPDSDLSTYDEPSSIWPQAQFLPSADIFALPYTVLF